MELFYSRDPQPPEAAKRFSAQTWTRTLAAGSLTFNGSIFLSKATATGGTLAGAGAGTITSPMVAGKFNITHLNDSGLTQNANYSVVLATAGSNVYQRNGSPYVAGSNEFNPGDFNVISGKAAFNYSNTSLSVDAGNNLVLNFSASPELLFGLTFLTALGYRRFKKRGLTVRAGTPAV